MDKIYFYGDFCDFKFNDILSMFKISEKELKESEVIFASFSEDGHETHYVIIFEKDNILYKVIASYCRCDSFEDVWDPKVTNLDELLNDKYYLNDFAKNIIREQYKV